MATAKKTTATKAKDEAQAADVTKASAPTEPKVEDTKGADVTETTENAGLTETKAEDTQAAATLATPAAEPQSTAETKPEEKAKVSAPAAKTEKVKALEITSKDDGFRRAGRAFSRTPSNVPLADLTEEQVEQLKNEPMLIVREIELDAE